jgi:hypothetical protein
LRSFTSMPFFPEMGTHYALSAKIRSVLAICP